MIRNIDKPDPPEAYMPTPEQILEGTAMARINWAEHRFLPPVQTAKVREQRYSPLQYEYCGDPVYVE